MTLIASVSGIRGTIGGKVSDNLTALDITAFTMAFYTLMAQKSALAQPLTFVIGRDARVSGLIVQEMVVNTLLLMGATVIDLGLSTTPTVEIAVMQEKAQAGIIVTASHNPGNWNALKLLNEKGEFISANWGKELLEILKTQNFSPSAAYTHLGKRIYKDYLQAHIQAILALPTVQTEKIIDRKFKIVLDPINSVGGIYVPALLAQLGVEVILINGEANGVFAHNPEPLPAHLTELSQAVRKHKADLGMAVDPDVDRLVLVNEDGTFFGEEYTLVAVADYILQNRPHAKQSAVVSNLSSSKALQDITEKHGAKYYASAVGEVHVVEKMKAVEAIIGGEGNGGIIDPSLHYGRDALLGIALILSYLALRKGKLSELRATYPSYYMAKEKIQLKPRAFFDAIDIQKKLSDLFPIGDFDLQDGIKRTLKNGDWVHIRASNTEAILRIYTESTGQEKADLLAKQIIEKLNELAL